MLKLILVLSILFTFLAAACNGPATYSPPLPWVPLSVGNFWVYDIDAMWFDEGDTTFISYQIEKQIIDLIDHTQGFQVYEQRSISHFDATEPDTTFYYYYETDEELRRYASLNSKEYYLELSFPLEMGQTWNSYNDSTLVFVRTVIDTDKTQNTPAGLFTDCALVQETYFEDNTQQFSYSRGCGLVQIFVSNDIVSSTTVLHSYSIE